jgi:hypothetical protein
MRLTPRPSEHSPAHVQSTLQITGNCWLVELWSILAFWGMSSPLGNNAWTYFFQPSTTDSLSCVRARPVMNNLVLVSSSFFRASEWEPMLEKGYKRIYKENWLTYLGILRNHTTKSKSEPQNQGSQGLRPENLGNGVGLLVKLLGSKGQRAWSPDFKGRSVSNSGGASTLPKPYCSIGAPRHWRMTTHFEGKSFPQSIDSQANFPWNHSHRHIQK